MNSEARQFNPALLAARRKTADYLRACGLQPADAERLGAAQIEAWPEKGAGGMPPDIAGRIVAQTMDRIDDWAARVVPGAGAAPVATRARTRARIYLGGLPARWPGLFLNDCQPPAELARALAAVPLLPTPELHQTSMVPQPLDLGPVSEVADETWRTFDKWPVLRGLTMWTLFLLLLGTVFYAVRF